MKPKKSGSAARFVDFKIVPSDWKYYSALQPVQYNGDIEIKPMLYNKDIGKFSVYTDWSFNEKSADFEIQQKESQSPAQLLAEHSLKFLNDHFLVEAKLLATSYSLSFLDRIIIEYASKSINKALDKIQYKYLPSVCDQIIFGNFCSDFNTDLMCVRPSVGHLSIYKIIDNSASLCYEVSDTSKFHNFYSIKVGKFNNSGLDSFIIVNNGSSFSFLYNVDKEKIQDAVAFRFAVYSIKNLLVGDYNSDGIDDILLIYNSREVKTFFFDSYGQFTESIDFYNNYDWGVIDYHLLQGDYNGDQKLDLVKINASIHHYLYLGDDGLFYARECKEESAEIAVSGKFDSINYDSVLKITPNQISIYKHMSEGNIYIRDRYNVQYDHTKASILPFDVDNDGYDDLVIMQENAIFIYISAMCPANNLAAVSNKNNIDYHDLLRQRHEAFNHTNGKKYYTENREKIPMEVHYIWFNNEISQTSLTESMRKIILDNHNILSSQGTDWGINLWVNDNGYYQKTKNSFESLGGKVHFIENLKGYSTIKYELEYAIKNSSFGKASDIARLAILKELGGVYLDIDYLVLQDLSLFNKIFDSYFGSEPGVADWLSNAMMASSKNHPIIAGALDQALKDLSEKSDCEYHFADQTIANTGPIQLSLAYFKYASEQGNLDIAFPSQFAQNGINIGAFSNEDLSSNKGFYLDNEYYKLLPFGEHAFFNTWSDVEGSVS